jgi:predicted dinucleotide-binding enzyme
MKIAIIGIGNVSGTLGPAWAKAGHEVIFGARDPSSKNYQFQTKKGENCNGQN